MPGGGFCRVDATICNVLVIRKEQMRVVRSQGRFVEEMADHLRSCFAGELAGMSQLELTQRIAQAIDRAETLGLASKQEICRFLNLSVFLGWDFLDLPANNWMQQRFAQPGPATPGERLLKIQEQVLFEIEARRFEESAQRP